VRREILSGDKLSSMWPIDRNIEALQVEDTFVDLAKGAI
jgi:hypothetical protein